MSVSLILAAHNEGDLLWRTVRSCVETRGELDAEIIIADDASHDGSIEETQIRFPQVRVVRHDRRRGAAPTKHLGTTIARGDKFLFLDGHCLPEPGSLARLVESLERTDGRAIVTPAVPALETDTWRNKPYQVGHGYQMSLDRLSCHWVGLTQMQTTVIGRETYYESPALIGCCLAVTRRLYEDLLGFDPHMKSWGVEDIDFGLKAWLCGHPVLHDPQARIGDRFRKSFDNYSVADAHLIANKLRFARKHYTESVWTAFVTELRQSVEAAGRRASVPPEGRWTAGWEEFQQQRASVEAERAFLMARRVHDEFWYAQRFGLDWPVLASSERQTAKPRACGCQAAQTQEITTTDRPILRQMGLMSADPSPSPEPEPSPSPEPCQVTAIRPETAVICVGHEKEFLVEANSSKGIQWSTSPGGTPPTGTGTSFRTKWSQTGEKQVTATCEDSSKTITVNVQNAASPANPSLTVTSLGAPTSDGPDDKRMVVFDWRWSVAAIPTENVFIYTHYELDWDIQELETGVADPLSNKNSEDYYFEGAATGLRINLDKGGVFNDGLVPYIRERVPGYDQLTRDEKAALRNMYMPEWEAWRDRHFTTNSNQGTVRLKAMYRMFGCVATEEFVPSLDSFGGARNQLPPGYPYPRIPNSIREPWHRRGKRHLSSAPAIWSSLALASGTAELVLQFHKPTAGDLVVDSLTHTP